MSDIIDENFSITSEKSLLQINPRKKFVIISLVILLVFRFLLFISEYIQYDNITRYFAGDDSVIDSLDKMGSIIIVFAMLFLLVFITTSVAVCVWIYRANQNLHRGGLDNIEYSSGWSVGWFFVPFANLVKPSNVMGEIDRGTKKMSNEFDGSAWKSQKNKFDCYYMVVILSSFWFLF